MNSNHIALYYLCYPLLIYTYRFIMEFDILNTRKKDIWKCFSAFKESTFEAEEDEDTLSSSTLESMIEEELDEQEDEDTGSIDRENIEKTIKKKHSRVTAGPLVGDIECESNASCMTSLSDIQSFELDMEDNELGMLTCSDCKTYTLIYKDGQYICTKCGVMQQRYLSHEAEYRCYAEGNGTRGTNPERVGMPTNSLLPESSLGTLIGHRAGEHQNIKRMIQYNTWHQMPYKERSLHKIFMKITSRCNRFGLPQIIIGRAMELYSIIKDVVMSRGVNRDALIAASTFFSCKDQGVPRSQKEIAEIYDISPRDMNRGIQHFREIWRLAKRTGESIQDDTTNPIDYIDRYCSSLPINSDIKHIAEFISIKAIMNDLVNDNTAPSIAAGSVYLACHICRQNITKRQVSVSCKISEVTISKCFKKLNDNRLSLLPKSVIQKYQIE